MTEIGGADRLELEAIARRFEGKLGFCSTRLDDSRATLEVGGDELFPGGSVILVAVALEVFCQVEEGDLALERSLELSSQELVQTNSEMRVVIQTFPDLFLRLDADGTIRSCRASNDKDLLLAAPETIGRRIQDVPDPAAGRAFAAALEDVRRTRSSTSLEYTLVVRDVAQIYEARLLPIHVPGRDGIRIELAAALAWIVRRRRQPSRKAPVVGDPFRHREPVVRVVDCGLQRLLERHRAEPVQHLVPAPDGAWHRCRQNTGRRHPGARAPVRRIPRIAKLVHMRQRLPARRLSAGIQGVELVLLRDVDDGEQVAANSDVHRLDQTQHRGSGHGGIDGVAASLQDVQARLCGQRLARGHHTVAAHDFGSMLREPPFRPIALDGAAPGGLRLHTARLNR